MSFLQKYKTDKAAEQNGVWIEVDDGVEIKVARLNNEKARELRRTLEAPYRNFKEVPPKALEDIMRRIVASCVLLDWKGVDQDADGNDVLYSPDRAEEIFVEYPDFFNDVVSASAARETFQTEALDAAKNV